MVKVATKGQREISEANSETLRQFGVAALLSSMMYLMGALLLWEVGRGGWVGWVVATTAQVRGLF